MSDPKRLRDIEEDTMGMLLRALPKQEPTRESRESVWAKVALTLPSGPGSGSGSGGGGAVGGAGVGAKLLVPVLGAVFVSAIAIGWMAIGSPPPRGATIDTPAVTTATATSATNVPSPTVPTPSAPQAELASSPPLGPPDAVAIAPLAERPRATVTRPPAAVSAAPLASGAASAQPLGAADRLREEAAGVRRVRQLLRDRDAAAALAELDRLASLVPNGPLEEEREVLAIESLAASGSVDAAARRADRFLFERPQSVHAARVREFSRR